MSNVAVHVALACRRGAVGSSSRIVIMCIVIRMHIMYIVSLNMSIIGLDVANAAIRYDSARKDVKGKELQRVLIADRFVGRRLGQLNCSCVRIGNVSYAAVGDGW